ncbi:MAG: hypothetical protein Q9218_006300 [Villophora microphyllina]
MSEPDTTTAAPLPPSISRPSSTSASASRNTALPSSIIADTNPPLVPSSTTSTLPSTTDFGSTLPSDLTSQTSTASNSQTSASATAVAAAASQPVLTKPQIAGVAVGSIAAAGLVFGLLALLFCLRERKRKRVVSDASFGNDKIIIDQPRTPSQPSAVASRDVERGTQEVATPEPYRHAQAPDVRPQSNRWSFWRKSMKPEDIGVAVAPSPIYQTARDRSPVTPMSAASYETTSRLLPDKPTYSLYPPPLRLSSYNTQVSPIEAPGQQTASARRNSFGPVIRPVPRGRGTMDTSQPNLHLGQPTLRAVPSDPFLDANSSSRTTDPRQLQTLPAQRPKPANSAPVVHQYGQWAEPVQLHRKPVPARLAPTGLRIVTPTDRVDRVDYAAYLPSHPASLAIDPSTYPEPVQPTRRKSSGKRKGNGKRPETFLSTTTDTSFEDGESDDEPPLPQSSLSTVVESPPSRARGAGVRYPVIPISAAESPSVNRTVREIRREQQQQRHQLELNPASDRSKGKARASPKTPSPKPSPKDKALPRVPEPNVPELAGTELRERQQVPDDSSERIKPGSAKWNILVAPGLENLGSPRSKASAEWTPVSTPTRKGR